ncbi:hypothetical protein A11A3_12158 [Alcanivorax hongdengensis A-11-3]|uniref:Uncharacterized protein n=1 Tax=Alcanivorax hongdengensis A-11-3 TaxID=1177179 RepID=L0W9S6_9GAMM|nr:hypothetical protein [Alcanivorax hongdengensis]EKF73716.1 hypothetical protein A11A3_12158 [Alcanivorax hongdengensis A-11-3]
MGSQGFSQIVEQHQLGMEAAETRIQALSEYLAVYRASQASPSGRRFYGRIRELRHDIWRLKAWSWYLSARQARPAWLAPLLVLARLLAGLVPAAPVRQRSALSARTALRLSTRSLLDRAYQALDEDIQGRLLTLRLAQRQRPATSRDEEIARLESRAALLAEAQRHDLRHSSQVAVICTVLAAVLRLRHWFGLPLPVIKTVDRT